MGKATSDRTALRYIFEVTEGVTPGTPAWNEIRYTGESLNYTIQNTISKEIRSDRMTTDLIPTQADAAGDVNFEMSYGAFDDLISLVMANPWGAPSMGTETIKNGVTKRSMSMQKHFQDADGGSGVYINYTGMHGNTWDLMMSAGAVVTGKFGFQGLGATAVTAQIASATFVDAPVLDVMSGVSNILNIEEDGVATAVTYRKIDLKYTNNCRARRALGSLPAIGIALGKIGISGSVEIYFNNKTILDKYLASSGFALSWDMTGSEGSSYTVTLPRVKFETGVVTAGGENQDIMFNGTYRAIRDESTDCMIQIDRTPTP